MIWWRKGNEVDGFWYKADLFDAYAEPLDFGILGDTLEALIEQVKKDLKIV